jgi:heat shock protein HslJ
MADGWTSEAEAEILPEVRVARRRLIPHPAVLLLAAGSLLSACAGPPTAGNAAGRDRLSGEPAAAARTGDPAALSPATTEEPEGALGGIAGAQWRLVRLTVDGKERPLVSEGTPTLAVDGAGKVQGFASVNRYFGQAAFAEGGRLRWVGPLGATRMAGPEPLMDQEQAFLTALERARTAAVRGGRLFLRDETGRTALEFER